MKAMLIETCLTGHHRTYLDCLVNALKTEDECIAVVPETVKYEDSKVKVVTIPFGNGIRGYLQWIRRIHAAVRQYDPEVVHFVYGDDLYRYFGRGLAFATRKRNGIVTCHQIRRSRLRDISIRCIASGCSHLVVHTESLLNDLKTMGIKNAYQIEYPKFSSDVRVSQKEVRQKLGITEDECVLLSLGGTREDKGLDLLLKALRKVKEPFHLIIAGKEDHFKKEYIEKEIQSYRDQVTLQLHFLSEEEVNECLIASDMIVLPYRKSFDGASGPLGEGVWMKKEIIGPSHGSLEALISVNHLGRVFVSEDIDSMAEVIEEELAKRRTEAGWDCDSHYISYREKLTPEHFQEQYIRMYRGEG